MTHTWNYSTKPTHDFIKLSDGTIINVAHVRRVDQILHKWTSGERTTAVEIYLGGESGVKMASDPDGKIYAWFAERAAEIGGDDNG